MQLATLDYRHYLYCPTTAMFCLLGILSRYKSLAATLKHSDLRKFDPLVSLTAVTVSFICRSEMATDHGSTNYSTLELAKHDMTANAPERDLIGNAPEHDHSHEAPEVKLHAIKS